jgi:putative phosphoribosyl transferase
MDQNEISGNLIIPEKSTSILVFAHGSGSTGTSYRNQVLAQALNNNGFSTLLFDLLTEGEKQIDRKAENITVKVPGITLNKFNIKLLTQRLISITEWVQNNYETKNLDIGYLGASTGAAAALYAAARLHDVKILVSRSGRVDLVDKQTLSCIVCPCLFIVGGNDKKVIDINKEALNQLKNVKNKKIEVIEDASHLFEGKMHRVAHLSIDWLKMFFRG